MLTAAALIILVICVTAAVLPDEFYDSDWLHDFLTQEDGDAD